MLAELSEFLNASVTPERNAVFVNTIEVLESIGFETHRDEITAYLSSPTSDDPSEIVDTVEGILKTAVRGALADFGIILVDDFDLDTATDMIGATGNLDDYEDHVTILNILNVDDTPESIMADLLELLGQFDSFRYIACIESVSPSLIERIEQFHQKDDAPEEASIEELRARSRTVAFIAAFEENPDLTIEKYVENGTSFGLPFNTYTALFEQIEDTWKLPRLAVEVMGLVLASDLEDTRLDAEAARFIEEYTHNVERAAQAITLYNKLKAEVFHA